MIGEPEMEGEGDLAGAVDLVSHTDRPPLLGRFRDKPWAWALGAAVVTSAVWAGALQTTGYGRTASSPDLHGYAVHDSPCTNHLLQPLAGDLGAESFAQTPPLFTRSAALDRVSCELVGRVTADYGWTTTYTIAVTVDLHKKADPAAEFDSVSASEVLTPAGDDLGGILTVDGPGKTTHPRGLGDRANLVIGDSRQSLYVLHGGAVFSLTLSHREGWDESHGKMPTGPDGSATAPPSADISRFTKDLAPTIRTVMRAMTQPPSPS